MLLLIAALAGVYFAPRKALFQESCAIRSCLNSLNLKCINNTCTCLGGYIYTNKCILKSKYLEKCHSTTYCEDNKNMICLDGVCKCADSNYWTGSTCSMKSTYTQGCSSDNQCLTSQMLFCDAKTKTCLCNNSTTRFWDQSSCFLKRTINERCNSSFQCRDWEILSCKNGKCILMYLYVNYFLAVNRFFLRHMYFHSILGHNFLKMS